jgi:hypothetical protein
MPEKAERLPLPHVERRDWLKAAAVHFERMETDERYRLEVKRRTYGLDPLPLLTTENDAQADI